MQSNSKTEIIEKIKKLKKEKNAVILAHCYQNMEVDEVADYVGDSLGLSQLAAKTDADIIVFLGVYFMAETAKILSPNKKVLIPSLNSGCQMADMINLEQLREFKAQNPDVPTVCYVNSTAEVKSEVDVCCTSANAVDIVKAMNTDKVLFVPDTYLGTWVEQNLPNVEVLKYPGFCPTHLRIRPEDVLNMKAEYPDAEVLVHPECHQEVTKLADFVGSTTQIIKRTQESDKKTFIIATEKGVVDRLQRDYPEKEFILVSKRAYCHNMKWHYLEDVLFALENEKNEVFVDEEIAKKALKPIEKMISLKQVKKD